MCIYIYIYIYITYDVVKTTAVQLRKPSSYDDFGVRYGFGGQSIITINSEHPLQ